MSNPAAALQQLHQNLANVMQCPPETLLYALTTLLCRGHLLIEDVPGTGKTTLARTLAKSLQLRMSRLQCTPDLMPGDITGVAVYQPNTGEFKPLPGPVFTNILLADELNRATPRAQSALLEAMEEGTVSLDRQTHRLPQPFMVMATQNPVEFSGTYPLPEAQLDRFFMRISLGYPDEAQELEMLKAQLNGHPLDDIQPVMTGKSLQSLQAHCDKIPLSEALLEYINRLVRATRHHEQVSLGASPRSALALMQASRAMTLLTGKKTVTPGVIQQLLEPVLGHRLVFRDARLLQAEARITFWENLLERVELPDALAADAQPQNKGDDKASKSSDTPEKTKAAPKKSKKAAG